MKSIFFVEENYNGLRVDKFLDEVIEDYTRSQIKKSFDEDQVFINDKPAKPSKKVHFKDKIEFNSVEIDTTLVAENIPLDIVYEDDDLAVINKAQGMTVHPAPGNYTGTLVNALLYRFQQLSNIDDKIRPGIVHRIDKDTAGLLVVAKNNISHNNLAEQIQKKTAKRTYFALVDGEKIADYGTIDKPIGRDEKDRKKMAVTSSGKTAKTHFKVIKRYQHYTLVQFDLETGRTHQIRVHCKHLGCPIVGDPLYGKKAQKFALKGQLLVAKRLVFMHPKTNKKMEFEISLPDYFNNVLDKLTPLE